MSEEKSYVRVGLGVIIVNKEGKILIGKRRGFIPKYSIPGGNLELGETFEIGATREVKEETNLDIAPPSVVAITNNLESFHEAGKHYVSIILLANKFEGELKIMEPEKCDGWFWCDPRDLPSPHFDASRLGVKCWLENKFYI